MAARYLWTLRRLVRLRPDLLRGLACCCDCGIRFFSHSCNDGRTDMRCAFGCREQHRRRESVLRSAAYYATCEGRTKRKALNARRLPGRDAVGAKDKLEAQTPAAAVAAVEALAANEVVDAPVAHVGLAMTPAVIAHVRAVLSRIDKRRVSLEAATQLLSRVLRQRSLDRLGGVMQVAPPHCCGPP